MEKIKQLEEFLKNFELYRVKAMSNFEVRIIYSSYRDEIIKKINKDVNLSLEHLLDVNILMQLIREFDSETIKDVLQDKKRYCDEYNYAYIPNVKLYNYKTHSSTKTLLGLMEYYNYWFPKDLKYEEAKNNLSEMIFSLDIMRELYSALFTRRSDIILDYLKQVEKDRWLRIENKIKNKNYDVECCLELGKRFLFVYNRLKCGADINIDEVTIDKLEDLASDQINDDCFALEIVMDCDTNNGSRVVDNIINFLDMYMKSKRKNTKQLLRHSIKVMKILKNCIDFVEEKFIYRSIGSELNQFLKSYIELTNPYKDYEGENRVHDEVIKNLHSKTDICKHDIINMLNILIDYGNDKFNTYHFHRMMTEKLYYLLEIFKEFNSDKTISVDEKIDGSKYIMQKLIKALYEEYDKENKKKEEQNNTELQIEKLLDTKTPYEIFKDLVILVSNNYKYVHHNICKDPNRIIDTLFYLNNYKLSKHKTALEYITYTSIKAFGEEKERPFIEHVAECLVYNPNDTRTEDEEVNDTCKVFSKLCELIDDICNKIENELFGIGCDKEDNVIKNKQYKEPKSSTKQSFDIAAIQEEMFSIYDKYYHLKKEVDKLQNDTSDLINYFNKYSGCGEHMSLLKEYEATEAYDRDAKLLQELEPKLNTMYNNLYKFNKDTFIPFMNHIIESNQHMSIPEELYIIPMHVFRRDSNFYIKHDKMYDDNMDSIYNSFETNHEHLNNEEYIVRFTEMLNTCLNDEWFKNKQDKYNSRYIKFMILVHENEFRNLYKLYYNYIYTPEITVNDFNNFYNRAFKLLLYRGLPFLEQIIDNGAYEHVDINLYQSLVYMMYNNAIISTECTDEFKERVKSIKDKFSSVHVMYKIPTK